MCFVYRATVVNLRVSMMAQTKQSLNCETIEEYQSDHRIACKYGAKCYQKNPVHVNKYKHPPKTTPGKGFVKKGAKRLKRTDNNKIDCPVPTTNAEEGSSHDLEDGHISDASSPPHSPKRKSESLHSLAKEKSERESNSSVADWSDSEPDLPSSPSDVRENIKSKFLFEMPEDFFSFWDLCVAMNSENPTMAFKDVGLKLVGPYDVLAGRTKRAEHKRKQSLYLLHWRYYYDPPEFQTVLKGDDNRQFHLGYFRDDPKCLPVFLASNCAAKNGVFSQVAENIFGAVNAYLNDTKKSANPFLQTKIPKLQKTLQEYAKENNFTLETKTATMKQRDRKSVSRTFNGLGLVVPVEKKTEVGYRELIETDANLRRILKKIVESEKQEDKDKAFDQLQQVITAANIANDECDFGTSVELGLNLFAFGGAELEQSALQLLSTGYSLLGRHEFSKIAQVHIKHRKKGVDLDIFAS